MSEDSLYKYKNSLQLLRTPKNVVTYLWCTCHQILFVLMLDPSRGPMTARTSAHLCCFWRGKNIFTEEKVTGPKASRPFNLFEFLEVKAERRLRNSESTQRLKEELQYRGTMLRRLFQRKPKHERLEEEPEVRFKGLLVSEKDLGYTYIRPGGKT